MSKNNPWAEEEMEWKIGIEVLMKYSRAVMPIYILLIVAYTCEILFSTNSYEKRTHNAIKFW